MGGSYFGKYDSHGSRCVARSFEVPPHQCMTSYSIDLHRLLDCQAVLDLQSQQ